MYRMQLHAHGNLFFLSESAKFVPCDVTMNRICLLVSSSVAYVGTVGELFYYTHMILATLRKPCWWLVHCCWQDRSWRVFTSGDCDHRYNVFDALDRRDANTPVRHATIHTIIQCLHLKLETFEWMHDNNVLTLAKISSFYSLVSLWPLSDKHSPWNPLPVIPTQQAYFHAC